ncbi:MAG: fumarate hydratase, partial [Caloramator sp.]|nr:fumarate hydratase [Caloramator sp.]
MREIHVNEIINAVRDLCIEANYYLNDDIKNAFLRSRDEESFKLAKDIMDILIKNAEIAKNENMPMCQDTGMTVVFLEVGQDVHIIGGNLKDAINEGVRRGYIEGYLRKSVVKDPIDRENTKDNTPAVIWTNIVPGDKLKITVVPKGFGSENMSQIKMLKPADGVEGIKEFVLKVVKEAGPNPCPPIIVGVGIGGTFEL